MICIEPFLIPTNNSLGEEGTDQIKRESVPNTFFGKTEKNSDALEHVTTPELVRNSPIFHFHIAPPHPSAVLCLPFSPMVAQEVQYTITLQQ
jgi:hypothetical protein